MKNLIIKLITLILCASARRCGAREVRTGNSNVCVNLQVRGVGGEGSVLERQLGADVDSTVSQSAPAMMEDIRVRLHMVGTFVTGKFHLLYPCKRN